MDKEDTDYNYCPECGEQVKEYSKRCEKCGVLFEKEKYHKSEYSNVQPVNKLFLLLILTGGLYQIYWFYRNWRDFKEHKNLDISPGLRTVGLFIPFVNLYFVGTQFKDLKDYEEEADVKPFSLYAVVISWVVLLYLSTRLGFYENPFTGLISVFLSFGMVIPFFMVQKTLNEYWLKEQGDLPRRKGLSLGEIITLVIGLILLIVELIGILVLFSVI